MNDMLLDRAPVTITAFDWVPDFAQGLVRDIRLRWALEEAGLPYDVELVPQGTQTQAHNMLRQPFGQIPTLAGGHGTMFESGACVWRIAEASETLLPADAAAREQCLSWVFAALNTVEPPVSTVAMLFFFEHEPEIYGVTHPDALEGVRPAAHKAALMRLKQVEDVLGENRHLVGGRFTVADLIMVTVLRIADSLDLLGELPGLRRYVALHAERPAFRAALEGQLAPFRENAAKYEAEAEAFPPTVSPGELRMTKSGGTRP